MLDETELRKDIEEILSSWYARDAPQRSADLCAQKRPGEKTDRQPADTSAQYSNLKIIGKSGLPPFQWSHSLHRVPNEDGSVIFRAEFAQPTREQPVPLVSANVYIICRPEDATATSKIVRIKFEEQEYEWILQRKSAEDKWNGMESINPMKWVTEVLRSKSHLPFDIVA